MREGWTETTLGDIAELISRGRAPSYCEEDGVVVLNQKCVRNGRIHFEFARLTNVSKKIIPEWAYLKVGDSLINSTGVGTLGRASFVPQLNGPTTFDSHVTLVRPRPDSCLASFVGLNLNFREKEIEMFAGGSTGQTELSREAVHSFPVTLPPIAEQKRIVDLVSSVDAYIDALQQQVDAARTARNAVLHELLTAGGDDWTETTLGAVAILNPKASALSKDAPFVPMDAVKVGQRFVTYSEPRGERSGARANSDDVLFARITPCLENGKVAQIQPELGACGGSTEFIVIRGSEKISADFTYFWATWSEVRKTATGLMTGTTGRQRLSANDLAAIQILLPPIPEQKRIVEIVSSMDDVIQAAERAVVEAKNLRSGLLSDLLSGEHEIPVSYDELLGAA